MPSSATGKDKALKNARAYYEKLMTRKQELSGKAPKTSKHTPASGTSSTKSRTAAAKPGRDRQSVKKSKEALQKGRTYYEEIMAKKSAHAVQTADRSELSNTSVQSVPKVKVRMPIQPSIHPNTQLLPNSGPKQKPWSKSLIVILVAALLFTVGFFGVDDFRPKNDHNVTMPSICFASSQPSPDESLASQCQNKQSIFKDCPHGGRCAGGVLQSCESVFFERSASHDACVLTTFASKKIATMVELLETWSDRFACQESAPYFVQLHEPLKRPMFSGNRMTQELVLGFDWSLIEAANDLTPTFVTQKLDNDTLVGLHPLFPALNSGSCQASSSMEPKKKPIPTFLVDNVQGKPWYSLRLPLVLAGSTMLGCVPMIFPFLQGLFTKRATSEEFDRLCRIALVRISRNNKGGITNHSLLQSMMDGSPTAHQKQWVQDVWPQVMEFLKQNHRIQIQRVPRSHKNDHVAPEYMWKWVSPEHPSVQQFTTVNGPTTLHQDSKEEPIANESLDGSDDWQFEDGVEATTW